jgi:hypothetical protein
LKQTSQEKSPKLIKKSPESNKNLTPKSLDSKPDKKPSPKPEAKKEAISKSQSKSVETHVQP